MANAQVGWIGLRAADVLSSKRCPDQMSLLRSCCPFGVESAPKSPLNRQPLQGDLTGPQ